MHNSKLNRMIRRDVDEGCDSKFTWRDLFVAAYFAYMVLLVLAPTYSAAQEVYSLSMATISAIGLASVMFKWKRAEAVIIVTAGLLLFARSIMFAKVGLGPEVPIEALVHEVINRRPLADGAGALLLLIVLSEYRGRRGRIAK